MNRKQRRKAGIKIKVPTYNLTQEQFDNAVNARIRAKESEYINQLMQIVTTVPMWVLRTKYGYGRDRLNKFIIEFNELVDSINSGYLDFDDIITTLKEEVDVDIKNVRV
jgi:hypothetical protein